MRKRSIKTIEQEIVQIENRVHKLEDSFADNQTDAEALTGSLQSIENKNRATI